MNTKQTGDVSEQAVILEILKRGWDVSIPIGDRLPYDIIVDINGKLIKIQIKTAWYHEQRKHYVVGVRRSCTNRKHYLYKKYNNNDFDFAICYLQDRNVFYVIPVDIFTSYKGAIIFTEDVKRQRRPRSYEYREAWHLLK